MKVSLTPESRQTSADLSGLSGHEGVRQTRKSPLKGCMAPMADTANSAILPFLLIHPNSSTQLVSRLQLVRRRQSCKIVNREAFVLSDVDKSFYSAASPTAQIMERTNL